MRNPNHEYEEMSIQESISILWRNKLFVMKFLIIGLLVGLLFTLINLMQNPAVYHYQAKVELELVDRVDASNQPQTFLHLLESVSILNSSIETLNITYNDYHVRTGTSNITNQYYLIVEGPEKEHLVDLANHIVDKGVNLVNLSMPMKTNRIVKNAQISGDPIEVSNSTSFAKDIVLFSTLFVLISFMIIYLNRFINRKNKYRNVQNYTRNLDEFTLFQNRNNKYSICKFFAVKQ